MLSARQTRSQAFFATSAGQWDKLRGELFGPGLEIPLLAGLLDASWTVGDLGCGTGGLLEALSPFVSEVVGVDSSAAMLAAARKRLSRLSNVRLERGAMEALPLDDASLDAALIILVLHHLSDPARALAEAARVLKPGGRLVVMDMQPHDRAEYRAQMGHVWLGFEAAQIERWLTEAGFEAPRVRPLPPSPNVKGPPLFAAAARRIASSKSKAAPQTSSR
ncbi:MAG: methyltransferase domain-containing protein [Myxococcales bacterium]